MFQVASAQIGARTHPGNAHLTHMALHGFPIDEQLVVTFQNDGDAPRPIRRVGRIHRVNRMLHGHLLGRGRDGVVVQASSAQRQHVSLRTKRQGGRRAVEQLQPLTPCQGRGQIFFEPGHLGREAPDLCIAIFELLVIGSA